MFKKKPEQIQPAPPQDQQEHPKTSNYELFYKKASEEIGEKEFIGLKNNQRILDYHAATDLNSNQDATPWCSSFVCWVIEQCGVRSTRDAWARSYLNWGKKLKEPVKGCIVVMKRGSDSGHVGFFHDQDEDYIYILGGNQNDSVCIKAYQKTNFLGFRGI